MSDTPKPVEERLAAWSAQSGMQVMPEEWAFISNMRAAAKHGVGYGWMQQIIEWEWRAKGPGALGPECFEKERNRLQRERDELAAALRDACPAPGADPKAWWERTKALLARIEEGK